MKALLQDCGLLSVPQEGSDSRLWPSFSASGRLCFKIVAFFQCLRKALIQDCGLLPVPREGSASRLWPSFSASGRLCFKIVAFQCLGIAVLQDCGLFQCYGKALLQDCGFLSVPWEGSASILWPSFSALG